MKHGKLTVNAGSMYSGKSSELIRQGRRYKYARKNVVFFKPDIDYRFSTDEVVTHEGDRINAIPVKAGLMIVGQILYRKSKGNLCTDVVLIDEVQFFRADDILATINELLEMGIDVIVSGLDLDRFGKPFGVMPHLLAIADEVNKFHAVCVECGEDGWVSYGDFDDDRQIVLGAKEKYIPLCRSCFKKRGEGLNDG